VRPHVDELLAEAKRIEASSANAALEEFAGSLDEDSYPPGYLERERRGWP
jgi:hypothetical protein